MNTININLTSFSDEYPSSEGYYLIQYNLTKTIELVFVYYVPEKAEFGIEWDGYYAVKGMRGKNVRQLGAKFCKVELELFK